MSDEHDIESLRLQVAYLKQNAKDILYDCESAVARKDSEIASLHQTIADFCNARWQPIETAPKDGTKIDLLYPYPRGRQVDWSWTDDLRMGWHAKVPTWDKGTLLPEAQWNTHTFPNMGPTHWMRSPPLPTLSAERPSDADVGASLTSQMTEACLSVEQASLSEGGRR